LCRYFGLSDGWWLRGQMEYDMAITKAKMLSILAAIRPRDLSPA
jgi:plasmid maintenance system antidote protein VapI